MAAPREYKHSMTLLRLALCALGMDMCRGESTDVVDIRIQDLPNYLSVPDPDYKLFDFEPSKTDIEAFIRMEDSISKELRIETSLHRPRCENGLRPRVYRMQVKLQHRINRKHVHRFLESMSRESWWLLIKFEALKYITTESEKDPTSRFSGNHWLKTREIRYATSKIILPEWLDHPSTTNDMIVDPDWYRSRSVPNRYRRILQRVWNPDEYVEDPKRILIPISLGNTHWVLGCIERNAPTGFVVHVIDSLGNSLPDTEQIVRDCATQLLKNLFDDAITVVFGQFSIPTVQSDGINCGMHVVRNMLSRACPDCRSGRCCSHVKWTVDSMRGILQKTVDESSVTAVNCSHPRIVVDQDDTETSDECSRNRKGSEPEVIIADTSRCEYNETIDNAPTMDSSPPAVDDTCSSDRIQFVEYGSESDDDNMGDVEEVASKNKTRRRRHALPSFEYHLVDSGFLKSLFTSYVQLFIMLAHSICKSCNSDLICDSGKWNIEILENGMSRTYQVRCQCGTLLRSLPSFCTSGNTEYFAREAVNDLMVRHQSAGFQTDSRYRENWKFQSQKKKKRATPKKHVNYATLLGAFNTGTGVTRTRNLLCEMGVKPVSDRFFRESQKGLRFEVIDLAVDLLATNRCEYVAKLQDNGLLRTMQLKLNQKGLRLLGYPSNQTVYVTAYFAYGSSDGTGDRRSYNNFVLSKQVACNLILSIPGTSEYTVGAIALDSTSCYNCTRSLRENGSTEHEGPCYGNSGYTAGAAEAAAHFRMASHCCHPYRSNDADRLLLFDFFSTDGDTTSYDQFMKGQYLTLQTYYDLTEEQRDVFAPKQANESKLIQAPDFNHRIKVFKKHVRSHISVSEAAKKKGNYFTMGMINKLTSLITQNVKQLATMYVYPAIKRYHGDMHKVFEDEQVLRASTVCEEKNLNCLDHICNYHLRCSTQDCAVRFAMRTLHEFNRTGFDNNKATELIVSDDGIFELIHKKLCTRAENGEIDGREMKAICSDVVLEAENDCLMKGLEVFQLVDKEQKDTATRKLKFEWALLPSKKKTAIRHHILKYFARNQCLRMSVIGTQHSEMLWNLVVSRTEGKRLSFNGASGWLAIVHSVAAETTLGKVKFRQLLDDRVKVERAKNGITATTRDLLDEERRTSREHARTLEAKEKRRAYKCRLFVIPFAVDDALRYKGRKRKGPLLPTTEYEGDKQLLADIKRPKAKRSRICPHCKFTHPPGGQHCNSKSTTKNGMGAMPINKSIRTNGFDMLIISHK